MTNIFESVLSSSDTSTVSITAGAFIACLITSLLLGTIIMLIYSFTNSTSKSFAVTLMVLPTIVQIVIMLVNGSIGTGIAVMGAFNLVRFRSAPGNAKEIVCVFLAMAVGLATGMGYLATAVILVLVIGLIMIFFNNLMAVFNKLITVANQFNLAGDVKELSITIPESLDYSGSFDDIFRKYLRSCSLVEVKTSNMGSLYKLKYHISLKNANFEKMLIDDLRCRNGNLEIACRCAEFGNDSL